MTQCLQLTDNRRQPVMTATRQHAEELVEEFSDHLELDVEEVDEQLSELVDEYTLPVEEAVRSLRSNYIEDAGLESEDALSSNDEVLVNDPDEDGQWVDIRVTVTDLWTPNSDSIAQVGLVGDESGENKFVSFETSDLPELEEGESYLLENVVTDEYDGNVSIKLNRTTEITHLEESVEVGDDTEEFDGVLIDIQSASGLIKRCSHDDCTRVIDSGRCSEHGTVDDPIFDLRIKAVFDNGLETTEAIFNEEMTEQLTGISLEEATAIAEEKMDTGAVMDEIFELVHGRNLHIEGPRYNEYLLVDEYGPSHEVDTTAVADKVRSI